MLEHLFLISTRALPSLTVRIFFITLNFWASMKLSSSTRMAMLTSLSCTDSLKCILAWASDIRIILSMCRTVIGRLPVDIDSCRRLAYILAILSWSMF